jgi:ABC-2 type transport system ATP-binding protein
VLDGVSLEVPERQRFRLVGTTIKILMNILQPTAGRAEVLGVDSRQLGPTEFALIGYVSENQEMPEWMTVEESMAYLKPFYLSWDDEHAPDLIARDVDEDGAVVFACVPSARAHSR